MDILSLIGVLLALVAIIGGSIAKGSGLEALWNAAAFVIVVVGTIAAALMQTRLKVFMHALKIFPWVFMAPRIDTEAAIEKLVNWSQIARKEGLLGLETLAEQEPDAFSAKGLQLLVDGTEPEAIRNILEVDLNTREQFDLQGAKVYESMGVYAPTLGIIGAVMGLMAVMQNLADPSRLGAGIAAAFVATIYGIASANLFFLPVGNKLKNTVQSQSAYREMIIDGIISIAEGENPRNIETKLRGYML
ncbi:flagellar motor protein [Thioalkalivibrio sulfidiphilus]|uniref:MotA/TolQ/ExbB proton channel n=1 Tax=Thioalkalivibrio sulfidiphilus (strain HL-EbGR7) TaxID=396588 RepID=B8GR08_THISH|nr:flagellar motor protein [Thioalkalivibrio sulfidiphilus]ACL72428.1 MotA/TolQ/ExbB proton channel [Thioalkalivibrio sulfidiphilus HL-EbGr7]